MVRDRLLPLPLQDLLGKVQSLNGKKDKWSERKASSLLEKDVSKVGDDEPKLECKNYFGPYDTLAYK